MTEQTQRTKCEIWTRVMGYHRPVSHFNIGKKAEHYSRKHFSACALSNASFLLEFDVKSDEADLVASCL